ncbi:hypothetical protein CALVIDRAFT_17715 [Calocera viscosa TUFC12733]|uniref:Uncharacterized protein n=1 Tax=Calocera viscosa (strain TUFC12733) TaxID=1330018 RepID=A0A167SCJ5_CALVF|nr:hypothetical protein CALVIDRAFT_17715 [Calocera viscosa TUFC12733]
MPHSRSSPHSELVPQMEALPGLSIHLVPINLLKHIRGSRARLRNHVLSLPGRNRDPLRCHKPGLRSNIPAEKRNALALPRKNERARAGICSLGTRSCFPVGHGADRSPFYYRTISGSKRSGGSVAAFGHVGGVGAGPRPVGHRCRAEGSSAGRPRGELGRCGSRGLSGRESCVAYALEHPGEAGSPHVSVRQGYDRVDDMDRLGNTDGRLLVEARIQ